MILLSFSSSINALAATKSSTYTFKSKHGITYKFDNALKDKIIIKETSDSTKFYYKDKTRNKQFFVGAIEIYSYKTRKEIIQSGMYTFYKTNSKKRKFYAFKEISEEPISGYSQTKEGRNCIKLLNIFKVSLLKMNFLATIQDLDPYDLKDTYYKNGVNMSQEIINGLNSYLNQLEKKLKTNPSLNEWNAFTDKLNNEYQKKWYANGLNPKQSPIMSYNNLSSAIYEMSALLVPVRKSDFSTFDFTEIDLNRLALKSEVSQIQQHLNLYKKKHKIK